MARPKRVPQHVEEEDISQEQEELEATEPDDEVPEDDEPREKVIKADAIRAAIREGIEKPDDAIAFIKDRFGLDVSKTHWSASRSQLRKKEGLGATPKQPRAAKAPAPTPRETKPETTTAPSADVIDDLEAVKSLVKRLGADGVRRIVGLFED